MPTHSELLEAISSLRASLAGLAAQVTEAQKARDAFHAELSDRLAALEKVVREQASEIGALKGALEAARPPPQPEHVAVAILRILVGLLQTQPIIPLLLFLLVIIVGAGEIASLYRPIR